MDDFKLGDTVWLICSDAYEPTIYECILEATYLEDGKIAYRVKDKKTGWSPSAQKIFFAKSKAVAIDNFIKKLEGLR